jgi:hypothetical protein
MDIPNVTCKPSKWYSKSKLISKKWS